jgi:putative membrane protein
MLKTAACFATVLLLGTAVASGSAQAQAASSASSATTVLSSHPGAKLPHADAGFLEQAAQNGHAEIEGSKLALIRATRPEVKAFAEAMVAEHTQSGEELKALAASKGVTVPDSSSIAQKAKLKLLSARHGTSFDKHYADTLGVQAHQDTIKLFQKAADEAKDPDVKAFAIKTLPVLQHHLAMSRDLYALVHQNDKKKP